MHIDRLNKLADFLDSVDGKASYDQSTWGFAKYKAFYEQGFHECGTSACALGWACTIPEFREQGLLDLTLASSKKAAEAKGNVMEAGYSPFDIGSVFFELTRQDSLYLFGGAEARTMTPAKKAAQIRKLIASRPECVADFEQRKAAGLI